MLIDEILPKFKKCFPKVFEKYLIHGKTKNLYSEFKT